MVADAARAAVLATMVERPDDGRHGLDLMRSTGLPSGALYRSLARLERDGLVTGRWRGERRTYLLTATGVTLAGTAPVTARRAPSAALSWCLVALVAAFASHLTLSRPGSLRMSDLGVYLGAVDGLRHGASLYDFMSAGNAPFTYPPFAGLLFRPLTRAPMVPLHVGWTLGTVATVVAVCVLLTRSLRMPRRAPLLAALLLISAPVASNLKYGQVSVALAALVLADVCILRRGRFHGTLIGVAAAIKLTPLIFIPMLWFGGRRAAAVTATATFVACVALGWAALPDDSLRYWGIEMWRVSRLGYITSVGNQSLNGALMRFGLDATVRSAAVLLVGGAVAAVAMRRAARLGRRGDWLSATVVTGAASVVLSPVSWTHHQVWLVLAVLLPVAGAARLRRAWKLGVAAVMLLPVTAIGSPVCSNARLLTAVVVACLLPIGHRADATGERPYPKKCAAGRPAPLPRSTA